MRKPNPGSKCLTRPLSCWLLCLALAVTACTLSDPEGTPAPVTPKGNQTPDALQLRGAWTETLRDGAAYFAGEILSFDFEADSVRMRYFQFTDVSLCRFENPTDTVPTCSSFNGSDTYRGTWTLEDSLLRIDFHLDRTTVSQRTGSAPMDSGRVEFKVHHSSSPDTVLLLDRISTDKFVSQKQGFRLVRPE